MWKECRRNRKIVVTKTECRKIILAQTAREKYEEEGRYRTCSTTIGRGRYPYLQEPLKLGITEENKDNTGCLSFWGNFSTQIRIRLKNYENRSNPCGHQPGCHLQNSPWPEIIKLFPARESLPGDIPAGDEKIADLFYSIKSTFLVQPFFTVQGSDLEDLWDGGVDAGQHLVFVGVHALHPLLSHEHCKQT